MADLFTPTDEDMRAMFIGNKSPEARGRMWDEWMARHDRAVAKAAGPEGHAAFAHNVPRGPRWDHPYRAGGTS